MGDTEEKTPLLGSGTHKDGSTYVNGNVQADAKPEAKTEKTPEVEAKKSASLGDLFRYATCLDKFLIFVGSLASLAHGGAWPVLMIFFGDMTNEFVKGPGGANFSEHNQTVNVSLSAFADNMTKYSIYYVYIGAATFVASYIQVTFFTIACERQVHKIRKKFFKAILRQEIGWFDKHQSGELTTRLADDLERVREGLGDKFSFVLQFLAAFLAGFGIGFWKGWKLALVMMSLTPLLAICAAFLGKLMTSFTKKEQESYAAAGSIAEEVLSCIRTVISFNGQKQDINRYSEALEKSKTLGQRKAYISGFGIGFTFLCMFSTYALAFWFGSTQVVDWYNSGGEDGISPGEVLTVFFCVMIGSFSIGNASPHISSIAAGKGAAAYLFDIIDNKPAIDTESPNGKRPEHMVGKIELKNVNFVYPTRDEVTVMKDFSLTVEPGQTVALVGPSGCGKSTVINLIQRFYDPVSGVVAVDGDDVRDLNLPWLRRNIGVVSQEPILFGYTIEENIRLGNPNITQAQLEEAAKAANAHDFISKLPQGYNTLVGERGAQLSGGQKQRVAIARALVRDPKILLLDEATSALDSESEAIVQAALDKAREGRTTIVIAHRLSTIQNVDKIYVIQDGCIVETGRHAELMAMEGAYHQLVTFQMLAEEEEESGEESGGSAEGDESKEKAKMERKLRKRIRTVSEDKTKRQLSRQTSKLGRQASKAGQKEKEEVEEEVAEPPAYMRILKTNKPEWPFIVIGVLASSVNGGSMPVFAIFFSEMINVFINKGENAVFWSMMFMVLGGATFICNFLSTVCFSHSGERLTMRMRLQTFTALLRQDVAYFDDPKHATGALTTRLATDASMIKNATGQRIAIVMQSICGMIIALVISFYYGWQLALVVLAAVPLMGLAGALQMKVAFGNLKKDNEELEKAGKTASEAVENIRTVQSLGRELYFYDEYAKFLEKPFRLNLRRAVLYGFAFGFSQGIVFMLYGGAFRYGAYMVELGNMTPDNVYKVFFAISFTGMTVGQATSFLPDYSKAKNAAGLIFKIMDTIPLIDVYSRRGTYLSKVTGHINFKNVRFHYPTRPDVEVLKGITLEVDPGQTIALVGPSGCGKSTVVSLLQRYYDPEQGAIEVDGVNIRDMNLTRLRYIISVVSQEPILFDCSIKDNIQYGLDAPISDAEIISAARAANIHDFVNSLPLSYETVVGEKGTQLSGGQKQRVAIARALVRNPNILLLDEATSALDTESEKVVQAALDNAQKGRTCIVIAHRLSTIQNADCIYVIDNGQVAEKGTHHELLAQKGLYANLVDAQQLGK